MANSIAEAAHMREVSDPGWRSISGTMAFALGVFICGSVGSYDPLDPSWNAATNRSVENLFGAGGAVFADVGRTWGRNPIGEPELGWLRNVGFGLRLAPTRASANKMIHIDIAFPLDGDPSIDSVQILLESKRSF